MTPLALLLMEHSSKEANGRGVQRCRWPRTLDGVHRSLKHGKSLIIPFVSLPPSHPGFLRYSTHTLVSVGSSCSSLLLDWVLGELVIQKTVAFDPNEIHYTAFSSASRPVVLNPSGGSNIRNPAYKIVALQFIIVAQLLL